MKTFRWSFSQWETYNTCPFKWKCQSVLKLPRSPSGPAAARGSDLHDRVEGYIKSTNTELDLLTGGPGVRDGVEFARATVARKYIPIFDEFKTHPNGAVHTEYKMGFTHDWYLTSAIAREASCIMVLDAVRAGGHWSGQYKGLDDGVVRIGEWKSGKPKDTHADQRKMYAIGGLKAWMADRVEVTTYYLEDTAPPQRFVATASAYPKLTALWSERRDLMIRDDMCAPRPGFYCRWCDFAASKGGPCKFS